MKFFFEFFFDANFIKPFQAEHFRLSLVASHLRMCHYVQELQMKHPTGGPALLEKGKDLAKGRTRKLEPSTK